MRARRPRLVVGNWKMNKTSAEASALAREIRGLLGVRPPCEVAICPPYTALEPARVALEGGPIALGAQNLHAEPSGVGAGGIDAHDDAHRREQTMPCQHQRTDVNQGAMVLLPDTCPAPTGV